jgi:DNA repair exonuclease SbcCD ATPase subunit
MKQITLKSLSLINFKGAKNVVIVFNMATSIFGRNGIGKTRIFDAFSWLLFGKDSSDRVDFNIKTLDETGNPLHKLDHEVCGVFDLDGKDVEIRRIYREKWQKKRGEAEAEFVGHETEFYWDGIPRSQAEFKKLVSDIISEETFKMITNPFYFNKMNWVDRRKVLISMAGTITNEQIAGSKPEFEALLKEISGRSMEDYKKKLAADKKRLSDALKMIPARIDEATRAIPEEPDYAQINSEINTINELISDLDKGINDISERNRTTQEAKTKLQNQLFALKTKRQNLEFAAKQEANTVNNQNASCKDSFINDLSFEQKKLNGFLSQLEWFDAEISKLNTLNEDLRGKWQVENAKGISFNESEFNCPTCKRPFEADQIEAKKIEMVTSFNKNKQIILSNITGQGVQNNDSITKLEGEKKQVQDLIAASEVIVKGLMDKIEAEKSNPVAQVSFESFLGEDYKKLAEEIATLEANVSKPMCMDSSAELVLQRTEKLNKLQALKSKLQVKDQIKQQRTRLNELLLEEKNLAQQISDIEKWEYSIQEFTKLKISAIEDRINQKFSLVKFRMFDIQVNGAEVECCDCLIDGVPFPDANTASKINAGIDIINVLCEFYSVYAPIFLDNRESCTDIIETKSQLVNLIVSPSDNVLRIA